MKQSLMQVEGGVIMEQEVDSLSLHPVLAWTDLHQYEDQIQWVFPHNHTLANSLGEGANTMYFQPKGQKSDAQ